MIRLCWNCYLWDVINLNKSADFKYQLSGRVVVITVIRTEVGNLLLWLFIVYIKPFFSKSAYTDMRFQILHCLRGGRVVAEDDGTKCVHRGIRTEKAL